MEALFIGNVRQPVLVVNRHLCGISFPWQMGTADVGVWSVLMKIDSKRLTRQMHSDGKKRHSFVALLFTAGDL